MTDNMLNECAVKCVEAFSVCQSFSYDSSQSLCQLYMSTVSEDGSIARPNTVLYYEALPGQVSITCMIL